MTEYAVYEPSTQPAWFAGPWGSAFFAATGLVKDAWAEAARLAVKARFPRLAPVDALEPLLDTFSLDALGDGPSTTRARLLAAWDTWLLAGTRPGLLLVLRAAGYANVTIQERVPGRPWWHYRLIIRPPFPWDSLAAPIARWGGGWRWGDGTRFRSLVPTGERKRLLGLLKKWSPAHAHCFEIVFVLEGKLWGEGWRWGDGTRWGGVTVRWRF